MSDFSEEYNFWLNFKKEVEEKIEELEIELTLASPHSHTDDEHQFLIKKVRMFRNTLIKIEQKLQALK